MRLSRILPLFSAALATAASWSFEDASISVQEVRGAELSSKKSFSPDKPLREVVALSATGSVRVALTITNGGKARRPHQGFLTVTSPGTGLEEAFPLNINDNGKARFDLTQAKMPTALLSSPSLHVSIVIGSFGSSKPLQSTVFELKTFGAKFDSTPAPRYTKQPEINHIFRSDPRSPPKILTLVFTLAVLACLPIVFITWSLLGANLKQLSKAFAAAPISHALFFGSIVSMEFVFYMYYTSWKLFQVLPVAGVVGLVAFLSGSGALTEVQERRLNGER